MGPTADGRKIAKTVTSVVAMGALGAAGLGGVAMYGTIAAASANKAVTSQTTPDTFSGSSVDSGPQSGWQPGSSPGSGTQLLPGNGGSSHAQSAGS